MFGENEFLQTKEENRRTLALCPESSIADSGWSLVNSIWCTVVIITIARATIPNDRKHHVIP